MKKLTAIRLLWQNWWKKNRKPVMVLSGVYTVAISAILRAGFHYKDDLGRAYLGYRQWNKASRYISEYLSVLLHADTFLDDISPLPQLLAALIMAFAGVIVTEVFKKNAEEKTSASHLAAVIPLALFPYFLECFSFQYDAPYMALSVLSAVLPVYFYRGDRIRYFVISFLCTLGMCLSYQSASGIFPMLVIFIMYRDWNSGFGKIKELVRFALISAAAYVSALLFYRVALVRNTPAYSTAQIGSLRTLLPLVWRKYLTIWCVIFYDMKIQWLVLMGAAVVLWVIVMVCSSVKNRLLSFLYAILTLFASSFLINGVYLVFKEDLFSPRWLIGLCAWLAFICSMLISRRGRFLLPGIVVWALSWCFFTFSFTYGNALLEQERYTERMSSILLSDLNRLNMLGRKKKGELQIVGDIGLAPALSNRVRGYKVLFRMVPVTLGNYSWGQFYFRKYLGFPRLKRGPQILSDKSYKIRSDTMYYTIRGDKKHLLITFKTTPRSKTKAGRSGPLPDPFTGSPIF